MAITRRVAPGSTQIRKGYQEEDRTVPEVGIIPKIGVAASATFNAAKIKRDIEERKLVQSEWLSKPEYHYAWAGQREGSPDKSMIIPKETGWFKHHFSPYTKTHGLRPGLVGSEIQATQSSLPPNLKAGDKWTLNNLSEYYDHNNMPADQIEALTGKVLNKGTRIKGDPKWVRGKIPPARPEVPTDWSTPDEFFDEEIKLKDIPAPEDFIDIDTYPLLEENWKAASLEDIPFKGESNIDSIIKTPEGIKNISIPGDHEYFDRTGKTGMWDKFFEETGSIRPGTKKIKEKVTRSPYTPGDSSKYKYPKYKSYEESIIKSPAKSGATPIDNALNELSNYKARKDNRIAKRLARKERRASLKDFKPDRKGNVERVSGLNFKDTLKHQFIPQQGVAQKPGMQAAKAVGKIGRGGLKEFFAPKIMAKKAAEQALAQGATAAGTTAATAAGTAAAGASTGLLAGMGPLGWTALAASLLKRLF